MQYKTIKTNIDGSWDLTQIVSNTKAIQQLLRTRLLEIKNTYEYNLSTGIDLELLRRERVVELEGQVKGIILNTTGILSAEITKTTINEDTIEIDYVVQTVNDTEITSSIVF